MVRWPVATWAPLLCLSAARFGRWRSSASSPTTPGRGRRPAARRFALAAAVLLAVGGATGALRGLRAAGGARRWRWARSATRPRPGSSSSRSSGWTPRSSRCPLHVPGVRVVAAVRWGASAQAARVGPRWRLGLVLGARRPAASTRSGRDGARRRARLHRPTSSSATASARPPPSRSRARVHRRDCHLRLVSAARGGPGSRSPPAGAGSGDRAGQHGRRDPHVLRGARRGRPSAASILSTLEPVVTVGLAAASASRWRAAGAVLGGGVAGPPRARSRGVAGARATSEGRCRGSRRMWGG